MIAKVLYQLQTSLDKNDRSMGKPIVSGKIKRADNANISWGFEKYTLLLQDKKKIGFCLR